MELSLLDRSNYFKGLLIMMGKDRIVDKNEIHFIQRIGAIFDYDEGFVSECINDLLVNDFLTEEPFVFQTNDIALAFIKDAVKLLYCDGIADSREYNWLLLISHKNRLAEGYCASVLEETKKNFDKNHYGDQLEIEKYLEKG